MASRNENIGPIGMAVLLHVVILGAMLSAFDFSRASVRTPLIVKATLVQDVPEFTPPPVVKKQPEPEPVVEEPEPEIEAPEPEPDNSEELRREAEQEKRRLDALLEQERLEEIRKQEQAEKERKAREEAERKKREEEDKERKRVEAERKREDDIKRQKEENERLRRELEAEQRQTEIDAESDRLAAVESGELAVYRAMISQKIQRNWAAPASATRMELKCRVRVRQVPGGEVTDVTILSCNGDDAVKRSVEAAVYRASPLPEPSDPSLFDRNLLLNLSIRQ